MEVLRFTEGLEQKIQADGKAKAQQIVSDGERNASGFCRTLKLGLPPLKAKSGLKQKAKLLHCGGTFNLNLH